MALGGNVLRKSLVAGLGVLVLGCGGMMGYGTEVGRTAVRSGKPVSLSYTAAHSEPHALWFAVDLKSSGAYGASGQLSAGSTTWQVDLDKSGSPIVGESGRRTLNWTEVNAGKGTKARGKLYGTELPAVPAGTKVTLQGTLKLSPGTRGKLELVVTD